jgi:hypothetical protein
VASDRPRETTASSAVVPRAPLDDTATQPLRTRLTWLLVFRAAVMTVLLATSVILRRSSPTEMQFERVAVALYIVSAVSYGSILAGAL